MATLLWPDKLSPRGGSTDDVNSHRRSVIDELVSGRDSAVQLQTLLRKDPTIHGGSVMAREIAEKILKSFTESIDMLSSVELGEVCDDGGSEDSRASKKRSSDSGLKDGRGCYKRRKGSHTWTEISTTVEDNYAWRKYGQKAILNAKFPRCYFRCTHKHDQGCGATKQVQRIEDNPEMYRIMYIGVHTCQRNTRLSPQMITDTDPWEVSDGSKPPQPNDQVRVIPDTVKQEHFKEDTPSDLTENSFLSLGSMFDREPWLVSNPVHDFSSWDMDEFMARLDGGYFAFDEIGNGL